MTTSVLEFLGKSTLRHLEYVGGLTLQLRDALGSLGQVLPVVGNRNRWRSVVRQTLAVGVDAFPMVGIMAVCAGFILAMQGASELRRFGAMNLVVGSREHRVYQRIGSLARGNCSEWTFRLGIFRRNWKHGGDRGARRLADHGA
jgi:ABC-type transporter Mla maintaining outer membrane lipid asymmetry permease subunit MlaE